jgi:hypothetical protein
LKKKDLETSKPRVNNIYRVNLNDQSFTQKMYSPIVVKQNSTETITKTDPDLFNIITSCCVGTLIEWYDFFIFGSMAGIAGFPSKFYKTGTPDGDTIAWLATYAVGFLFRPFGSVVFGYVGDKVNLISNSIPRSVENSRFLFACYSWVDALF